MSVSISPIARMAAGLTALVLSVVLVLDFVTGALDGPTEHARSLRKSLSEQIAVQLTGLLARGDAELMRLNINEFILRNESVLSVAIRPEGQPPALQAGDHEQHWRPPAEGRSTLNHVIVPVKLRGQPWGTIEISYRSMARHTWWDWVSDRKLQFFAGFALSTLLMFYLYLRKALRYLDPSAAVPNRVSSAFDSLTEAVLIIDRNSRIMLANSAFKKLVPHRAETLVGKAVGELSWLSSGLADGSSTPAWTAAMQRREPVRGAMLEVVLPDNSERRLTVNASPVLDEGGSLRGCMVSFDDVTKVEEQNFKLQQALQHLNDARAMLQQKNAELEEIAHRDPLTGCLNRRAFFAQAEKLERAAHRAGTSITAVMLDVDHFKQINDRYGHVNGDRVLQQVAKVLSAEIRGEDLLGRYGGEEFALVLPGLDHVAARDMVERLRATIEGKTGLGLRKMPWLVVTASFGYAVASGRAVSIAQLLADADKAMYEAKRTGRNRWVYFEPDPDQPTIMAMMDAAEDH